MCRQNKPVRLTVLGGTSKVWQAMVPHWRGVSQGAVVTHVWARRAGPGVDFVSSLEDASDVLSPCDVVLALWGVTQGSEAQLKGNSDLACAAQDLGRRLKAQLVLHAMTAAIYAPASHALNETAEQNPRHPYGRAKQAAEQAVLQRREHGDPGFVFLRLGNVVGTDALAAAAQSGRLLKLDRFADGRFPRRSYIAPDDLAAVVLRLIQCDPSHLPTTLNVAGPHPVAMDALLRAAHVPFEAVPAAAGALPVQHLDVTRLAALGAAQPKSSDPVHLARFLRTAEQPTETPT